MEASCLCGFAAGAKGDVERQQMFVARVGLDGARRLPAVVEQGGNVAGGEAAASQSVNART
jgi:hypothetical protein